MPYSGVLILEDKKDPTKQGSKLGSPIFRSSLIWKDSYEGANRRMHKHTADNSLPGPECYCAPDTLRLVQGVESYCFQAVFRLRVSRRRLGSRYKAKGFWFRLFHQTDIRRCMWKFPCLACLPRCRLSVGFRRIREIREGVGGRESGGLRWPNPQCSQQQDDNGITQQKLLSLILIKGPWVACCYIYIYIHT